MNRKRQTICYMFAEIQCTACGSEGPGPYEVVNNSGGRPPCEVYSLLCMECFKRWLDVEKRRAVDAIEKSVFPDAKETVQ